MLDHNIFYALTDTLATGISFTMECRCQIINFWLSASKWYMLIDVY